jgi:hypothetical protein
LLDLQCLLVLEDAQQSPPQCRLSFTTIQFAAMEYLDRMIKCRRPLRTSDRAENPVRYRFSDGTRLPEIWRLLLQVLSISPAEEPESTCDHSSSLRNKRFNAAAKDELAQILFVTMPTRRDAPTSPGLMLLNCEAVNS